MFSPLAEPMESVEVKVRMEEIKLIRGGKCFLQNHCKGSLRIGDPISFSEFFPTHWCQACIGLGITRSE